MSHYFIDDNKVKSQEKYILVKIGNLNLKFFADNGVFSKRGLDFGTRTLLENIPLSDISGNVLDFGCGWGPIGIYIAKNTSSKVDMIDINDRALNLAKKNVSLNEVSANVFKSDIYDNVFKNYDYIITNPPIRVGKKVLYEILFSSLKHLKKEGKMYFVINKNQGAKSVLKDLNEIASADVICKNKGFYIIRVQNR